MGRREMNLREVRKSQGLTQAQLAEKLGITREAVSKRERSGNMRVNTLMHHMLGLGGRLAIFVRKPDGTRIELL